MYDRAAEFVLKGGKRLRPRLALASYRILTGLEDAPTSVWSAAASLELFHAFMLVHDDLIDGSLTRRDRPTLHEIIRLDADWPDPMRGLKYGADLALIAGDLLCALGMRMLGRSGLDDAALGRAHRLISDMLLETGVGEALDVIYDDLRLEDLEESQILDAYLNKTARYSVSAPLALGATIAGAPMGTLKAIRRFGDLLGLGYQLQNDLDAIQEADAHDECPDLDSGKRTWILWTAYHSLGDQGRASLRESLAMPRGDHRRRLILGLIDSSGARELCRSRLDAFHHEAATVLRESSLDSRQRRAFLNLVPMFTGSASPCDPGSASVLDASLFPQCGAEISEGV